MRYSIDGEVLTDIADAIREKTNSEQTFLPGDMAEAIQTIPQGGITPTGIISITENGTVDVTNYASANVNVSGGSGGGTYIASEDGKIGVEVINVGMAKWYFNGYQKEASDVAITDPNLTPYLPMTNSPLYSKAYGADKTTQIGQIGFYQRKMRSWSINTTSLLAGTFWGVVHVMYGTTNTGEGQINPYEEPPV